MTSFEQLIKVYDYIRPILDIAILTFILYKAYEMIVKTQGMQIFRALLITVFAYAVVTLLKLSTLQWLLNLLAPGLLVCFAIIFQPELRKIFMKLGQGGWRRLSQGNKKTYLDSVLVAAEMLSKQKRGMLLVFLRHTNIADVMETGTPLNAELTSSLLVTIFGHDTPLHDGATIVQGSKILNAGCFLPLSEQYDIKKTFGTRHRAALGLAECTDAVILVVSEETGAISLAYDSRLHYDLTLDQATKTLENLLDISGDDDKDSANER